MACRLGRPRPDNGRTWLAVLKHGGTLGPCFKAQLQLRRLCVQRGKWFPTEQDGARPGARIQSGPSHAAKGGASPPPTIMAITSALPRLLMATAAPAMTWLAATQVSTSLSSTTTEVTARAHIARACLGLMLKSCPRVPLGCMQGGSHWSGRAVEPERARWHDPVLGRWLGLTPERTALCLSGYPRRPRVALSRVSDPPGLGRR